MATYTVSKSVHAILDAEEADLVVVTGSASEITVIAYPAELSDYVYFTYGDDPVTAEVAADNTNVAIPGIPVTVKFDGTNVKVSLISDSAVQYSVIAS